VATSYNDWPRALDTARQRLRFENRLGLYERLDAHSMVSWMSYLMGDLAAAERDSGEMVARLLPGQAPFPALHLYAWRTITLMMLGRWDEAGTTFWRLLEAWNDAGRHAAGYGLRGFLCGVDMGRARHDARMQSVASESVNSILSRFPLDHQNQVLKTYLQGEANFSGHDPSVIGRNPPETAERRLCLANDNREVVPANIRERLLARAIEQGLPLLEAQVRRSNGLAGKDPGEVSAAIAFWEKAGSLPNLGRGLAERGMLTGNAAETDSGLAILKKVGDVNYIDRFSARV
ncbi:MAG: hypothetical protein ACXWN0_17885, partial [Isosphaeraceae bacterium]